MLRRVILSGAAVLFLTAGIFTEARPEKYQANKYRLNFTEEELAAHRQRAQEVTSFRIIEDPKNPETSYAEWIARQGEPKPFSAKYINTYGGTRDGLKICVIANETLYPSIESSLDQYSADLTAEGHTVEIHTSSGGTPEDLRSYLQNLYSQGMDGSLFIGDLPVAWYEAICNWKDKSYEDFPCDLYYMDLDGTFADTNANSLYDMHTGDQAPEIFVGRLTASPLTMDGADEVSLLQNYFQKNHIYRTGGLITNTRALVFVDDDWYYDADFWNDCMEYIYCYSFLLKDQATTISDVYEANLSKDYEFIHVAAHSNWGAHYFDGPGGTGGTTTNTEIKHADPVSIFYSLFACSNARFVETNYMGGWYIFTDTYGLAATGSCKVGSMLYFDMFYYPLGNGATIGEAFREWWTFIADYIGISENEVDWFYGMTLLGDPTLMPRDRRPVYITSTEMPYGLKGSGYSAYLSATGGGAPPYDWDIIAGNLPIGVYLDASTGIIYGLPLQSGTFDFLIQAEDQCVPVYSDSDEFQISIINRCGDATNDGNLDFDDVYNIFYYLYGGTQTPDPVPAADVDGYAGVSNHDAQYLSNYLGGLRTPPYCPPFADSILPVFDDVLEICNTLIPAGSGQCRTDFYLNSEKAVEALAIPFTYSCATSPVTCDSISFIGSQYSHYELKGYDINNAENTAVVGFVNIDESVPPAGEVKIGSAWFTVTPSTSEQEIIIDTTRFSPDGIIVFTTQSKDPFIPTIEIIPEIPYMCGDVTDDGDVNILDIVFLINYKYKGGPAPEPLESGDVNSDESIDILDIVYIINYKYKNGPEPDCP